MRERDQRWTPFHSCESSRARAAWRPIIGRDDAVRGGVVRALARCRDPRCGDGCGGGGAGARPAARASGRGRRSPRGSSGRGAVGNSIVLVSACSFRFVFAAAATAAAIVLVAASAQAPASLAGEASVDAYAGLGTWVDVYDAAAWAQPERAVNAMSAHGVATLFLQTSNYRRAEDVVRPDLVARFIAAAHDRGINVVAWYLPSLSELALDYRRAMRAIRFRTSDGDEFDSFALDIEARVVRSPSRRTARLLRLSSSIRRSAGLSYPLGAVVRRVPADDLLRVRRERTSRTRRHAPRRRAHPAWDEGSGRSDSRDRRDREPRRPLGGERIRRYGARLRRRRREPLRLLGYEARPMGGALARHALAWRRPRDLPLTRPPDTRRRWPLVVGPGSIE